jgi:hypothetical protein
MRFESMPFPIKMALSIIVLLVAGAAYMHQDSIGQHGTKIAIMLLAPFMVIAMWIFPEIKRK